MNDFDRAMAKLKDSRDKYGCADGWSSYERAVIPAYKKSSARFKYSEPLSVRNGDTIRLKHIPECLFKVIHASMAHAILRRIKPNKPNDIYICINLCVDNAEIVEDESEAK
jgi:hypothetical protein